MLVLFFTGCAGVTPLAKIKMESEPVKPEAGKDIGNSIMASAVVRYTGTDGKKSSGKAFIAALKPDLFRVEVKGPLGTTAVLLVSDGYGLYTYSGGESNYRRWIDGMPLGVTAAEMVDFLMGFKGVSESARRGNTTFTVEKDDAGRVINVVRQKVASRKVRAHLSDYKELYGTWFPYHLSIATAGVNLIVEYRSVELGTEFTDGLFETEDLP